MLSTLHLLFISKVFIFVFFSLSLLLPDSSVPSDTLVLAAGCRE